MKLGWDSRKAAENLHKHGVDFADAGTVLHDEQAITIPDESSDDEERFVTLGMDTLGRVLVVVYTWREDRPPVVQGSGSQGRRR